MQKLISYLYGQHINSKDEHVHQFARSQGVKIYALNAKQQQFYKTMLARNFFSYSASTMQIKLSLKHLFGLYRMHRFQQIMKKNKLQGIFSQWIDNQMMPIQLNSHKLIPNNCPYVYIDFKEQNPKQKQQIYAQQLEVKRNKSKTKKQKQKPKAAIKKQGQLQGQKNNKCIVMVNILQLTIELQNQVLLKQLQPIYQDLKIQDLKNQQKRNEFVQKFIQIRIQEYISQRFDANTLMTLNFIRKYSFIQQKQLLNKTLLSAAELRKSLSLLIIQGFIIFYPQNSKTMLYKAINNERLKQKYIDHVCQTILNLHIFMTKYENSIKDRMDDQNEDERQQKMCIIMKSLAELDQILMICLI